MDDKEIFDAYDELSEHEAFEVFNANDVDIDDIALTLGRDVAHCYLKWIYASLK